MHKPIGSKVGGARLIYFDTTHGTNEYGMKLGCFTSVDQNLKTIVLEFLCCRRKTQSHSRGHMKSSIAYWELILIKCSPMET